MDKMKQLPLLGMIGAGAVLWGVLLLVVWAIHPVEGSARFAPVENPSVSEQASIDRFLGDGDDPKPLVSDRFDCDSTPLDIVSGSSSRSSAPPLPLGFEYVGSPCETEYSAARSAAWVNMVAIGLLVGACLAIAVGQRKRSDTATVSFDDEAALLSNTA